MLRGCEPLKRMPYDLTCLSDERKAFTCLLLNDYANFSPPSTPVTHLLSTHLPSHINAFAPIVTRDFRPPKPSPAGILHIAKAWGVEVSEASKVNAANTASEASDSTSPLPLIMVGDSIDDIIAGYDAGALTVLVKSPGKEDLESDERTHVVIERLDELVGLLEKGIEAR